MLSANFMLRQNTNSHVIYCRITLNKQRATAFSTGIKVDDATKWCSKAQRMRGVRYSEINERLRLIVADIMAIHNLQIERGRRMSATLLRQLYLKPHEQQTTLLDLYGQFIARMEKQSAASTVKTYRNKMMALQRWLVDQKLACIEAHAFSSVHLNAYAQHLQARFSAAHASRSIELIKRVLKEMSADKTSHPALDATTPKRDRSKQIVFLTEAELNAISATRFTSPSLQRAADCFLFQCYTGLAYYELSRFGRQHIVQAHGVAAISMTRQKTSQNFHIPLLPPAADILQRYDYQLPVLSSQAYNRYVKQVADICGIMKHVTSHTARKTFATQMLAAGVSIEVVSRMMGHQSVVVTQKYYAAMLSSRVVREMQQVAAAMV